MNINLLNQESTSAMIEYAEFMASIIAAKIEEPAPPLEQAIQDFMERLKLT